MHFEVSIGVASMASPESNVDVLLHWADTALYETKSSEKKCVAQYDRSHPKELLVLEVKRLGQLSRTIS